MKQEGKTIDPKRVYEQSADKQRIVITGAQSFLIASIIIHVLKTCKRDFDFVFQAPLSGMSDMSRISKAPIIIVQESATPQPVLLDYHHHIGIISQITPTDAAIAASFADQSPKGGVLICSETEPAQAIGKKERPGVTTTIYNEYPHTQENGQIILLSGTKERVPVKISGPSSLHSISAARELLKKVGITSGQFYPSISQFQN